MAKGGWCIDMLHDVGDVRRCKFDRCDCSCHTGVVLTRPKKKTRAAKPKVEVKLNKDGSVPKKRGRPKGSKNKPK